MMQDRYRRLSTLRLFACCLALWASAALAFAATPRDVILVLDNSGSMKANDPGFLLKRAVSNFVTDLDGDTHLGIVMFAEKVDYAVPLAALDADTRAKVDATVNGIDYRGKLTNSPAAIERAIYELKTTARPDAAKVVLFMTDGIVDTGNPAADTEKANWLRTELAADAAESGIKVFGIAFTDNADFFLIQSIAQKTGGEYFRALKPEDLNGVFGTVQERIAASTEAPAAPVAPVETPAPAPAAPAVAATPAGDCLSTMPAEERAGIAEAAAEAGLSAEELCEQMQQAPTGAAIVVPAPAAEEDKALGLAIIAGAGALLLLVVIAVVVLLRRRGGTEVKPARPAAARAAASVAAVNEPPAVPEAFLKDLSGAAEEPAVQLTEKPLIVGRVAGSDPAHLDYFVVNKATVGRRHAMIKFRDYGFWISDQGSVNGTFLNGDRIENERQLKHGDRIKFHKFEFEFSMPEMDDGGRTLFADPGEATMIGSAATLAAPVAASALAAAAPDDDDVFDLTGGAALPTGDDDRTGPTAFSPRGAVDVPPLDDEDDDDYGEEKDQETIAPSFSRTAAREAAFDAEASAFFDDGALGVTSGPPMPDFDFDPPEPQADDGDDAFSAAATAIRPAMVVDEFEPEPDTIMRSLSPLAEPEEVEAVTLLPSAVSPQGALEGTSDISIDDFMKTDSFEVPIPGLGDDEDATLMPGEVPAIDDVFDLTAEGTIPPVSPIADADDDDDAPTQFLR